MHVKKNYEFEKEIMPNSILCEYVPQNSLAFHQRGHELQYFQVY